MYLNISLKNFKGNKEIKVIMFIYHHLFRCYRGKVFLRNHRHQRT